MNQIERGGTVLINNGVKKEAGWKYFLLSLGAFFGISIRSCTCVWLGTHCLWRNHL